MNQDTFNSSFISAVAGQYYHIKDQFFADVQDDSLMSNKENGGYRPHYLAIRDSQNADIFWMIPVSSQYQKYQMIYNRQLERYKKCTKIVLGKCAGREAAYLIQNAFPITVDYFSHVHISQGQPLTLHTTTANQIACHLEMNLRLHRRGVKLFYADIDRIYQLMQNHLADFAISSPKNK